MLHSFRFFARFLIASIVVLFITQTSTTAAAEESSRGCLRDLLSLTSRLDQIGDAYRTEVCAKGCQPTTEDWDRWTYQQAFLPLVHTVTSEIGLSSTFADTWIQVGSDLADSVKKNCHHLLNGKHFCAESEALTKWGSCFKEKMAIVGIKNSLKLLPLVRRELCQGDYGYLQSDQLWDGVLRGYMREYAAVCKKGSAGQDREL